MILQQPGQVYFLLSAFANMASARDWKDRQFIERAALDLFDVGFVCTGTRDHSSKVGVRSC